MLEESGIVDTELRTALAQRFTGPDSVHRATAVYRPTYHPVMPTERPTLQAVAGPPRLSLTLAVLAVTIGVVVLLLMAWPVTETCEEHARRGGYGAISRQCLIVEDRLFRWDVRLWHLPRLHQWLTAGVVAVGSWVALVLAAHLLQRR